MAYIVEKYEDQFIDAISNPEQWTWRNPAYAQLYAENAAMRAPHEERGTTLKTPEWKLIARIQPTLEDAIRLTKDGGFIKDKKALYAWLKRNPAYLAYDAKFGG